MNTLFGANWRTTLSGWVAVLASAIAINPGLVDFLPEWLRSYVTGIAGLMAVVSGGAFAIHAKDKRVTGGSVPNDCKPSANSGTAKITPLIAVALLPLVTLSGCAWISAHQSQINSSLAVVGQRALDVAERVLISAAVNEADKNFKADFLDAVAEGLRQNQANIVTSDDIARIVQIWAPNDGAQWQKLAGNLGAIAGNALQSAGKTEAAAIVESIATGLNDAAANARAATPSN